MTIIKRTIFFLKYNWGAAFIVAFAVFMIASAFCLELGLSEYSNLLANYGFYSLILGVPLQFASYLLFGNKKYVEEIPKSTTPKRFDFSRKFVIVSVILVSAFLLLASLIALYPASVNPTVPLTTASATATSQILTNFQAIIFFAKTIPEPNNQTLLAFGINANGASAPYIFMAVWSDGFTQSNVVGTFSRTISGGQLIPSYATVTITSVNNKSISIKVPFPAINTTVATSSRFQNTSNLTFLETGFPSHTNWSVGLNASVKSSTNNSIVFESLKNGFYNFRVNYQFNGSLDNVFTYSPAYTTVLINGTDEVQRINFSNIPVNELVTPTAGANESLSNNLVILAANYRSSLPTSLVATVVAVVNDSSGRLVTISTATLDIGANSMSTAKILLESLVPGKYSATLYVIYENTVISPKTETIFSR